MNVSITIARDLIYFISSKGFDIKDICEAVGIIPADLENSELDIDASAIDKIWREGIRLTGDELIGLRLGVEVNFNAVGIVGFIIQNSETLLSALERGVYYHQLYSRMVEFKIETFNDLLECYLTPLRLVEKNYPVASKNAVESSLAFMVKSLQKLSGKTIKPLMINFTYPAPQQIDYYEKIFECPLVFSENKNSIIYRAVDLQNKVLGYNREIYSLLDGRAEEILRKSNTRISFTDLATNKIAVLFKEKYPSIEQTADALNVSVRTLQRKLKNENVSFQLLVDKTQKDLAINYVSDKHYSISEIAYILGYSEPTAFSRAFKRWTGKNPSDY